eukprot:194174-Amphidinium_carterae.1
MDTILLAWWRSSCICTYVLNIPYLQWRGRWANPKTMVRYLQTSLGARSYAQVGHVEKLRILALPHLAPSLLSEPCDTQLQHEYNSCEPTKNMRVESARQSHDDAWLGM